MITRNDLIVVGITLSCFIALLGLILFCFYSYILGYPVFFSGLTTAVVLNMEYGREK